MTAMNYNLNILLNSWPMNTDNTKLLPQKFKYVKLQGFSKTINQLHFCRTILYFRHSISHMLSNEMKPHINMLAFVVWIGFLARLISNLLSILSSRGFITSHFNSFITESNHIAWQVAKVHAMYSTSQDESAVTDCLLVHQDIAASLNLKI